MLPAEADKKKAGVLEDDTIGGMEADCEERNPDKSSDPDFVCTYEGYDGCGGYDLNGRRREVSRSSTHI